MCRLGRLAGCLGSTSGSQTSQLACSPERGELPLCKHLTAQCAGLMTSKDPFTAAYVSVYCCNGSTALSADLVINLEYVA